jgi:hypothetical protein
MGASPPPLDSGLWLSVGEATKLLKVHRTTLRRLQVPWVETYVPGKIRYAWNVLKRRHLYKPDVHTQIIILARNET